MTCRTSGVIAATTRACTGGGALTSSRVATGTSSSARSATAQATSTPLRATFSPATSIATGTRSTATTGDHPSLAATIASVPTPHPRSAAPPDAERSSISATHICVVGCEPDPNALPRRSTTTSISSDDGTASHGERIDTRSPTITPPPPSRARRERQSAGTSATAHPSSERPAAASSAGRENGAAENTASDEPFSWTPAGSSGSSTSSSASFSSSSTRKEVKNKSVARRRRRRIQIAPQVADLVAQLGRVLEAQLLRGGEHLLLELAHRLLDLRRCHVGLRLAAPPALGRDLGVRHQELRDVRDALDDRLRGDPVLLVVGDLDRAAAIGLLERRLHRRGLLVGVHDHRAVDVAGRTPDRLDERRLTAEEALLVRVEDRDERHLGEVQALAEQVHADEHVVLAEAQLADDLDALQRV